jgi:hypothetical protein
MKFAKSVSKSGEALKFWLEKLQLHFSGFIDEREKAFLLME